MMKVSSFLSLSTAMMVAVLSVLAQTVSVQAATSAAQQVISKETAAAAAAVPVTGHVRKLLLDNISSNKVHRQLEGDGDGDDGNDDSAIDTDFLMNYSLKLLQCTRSSSKYVATEYVILRACPQKSCKNKSSGGCTSGYADFAVPLADFVAAYVQDQQAQQVWAEDDQVTNLASCTAFDDGEEDGDEDDDDKYNQQVYYYVGPTCSSNGKDIELGLFEDAYCSLPATEMTLADLISNNVDDDESSWNNLPFSTSSSEGGMIGSGSSSCMSCAVTNNGDDDGAADYVKDMCATFTDQSTLRCESEWGVDHYYWDPKTQVSRFGKDTSGCSKISAMTGAVKPNFLFHIFLFVFVLFGFWFWKKHKQMQKQAAALVGAPCGGASSSSNNRKEEKAALAAHEEASRYRRGIFS